MKPDIHPDYKDVVFQDTSMDPPFNVLTRSTATTTDTIKLEDGNTYPLVRLEVSSASHPFYTGKQRLVDTAGMIERYNRRYGKKETVEPATAETPAPDAAPSAEGAAPAETFAENTPETSAQKAPTSEGASSDS